MSRRRKPNSCRPQPDRTQERAEEALRAAVVEVWRSMRPPLTARQIALSDQIEASARDRMHRVRRAMPRFEYAHGDGERGSMADAIALVEVAMRRRGVVSCRHFQRDLDGGAPVFVRLTERLALCMICSITDLREVADDGCCDICDLPVVDAQFREVVLSLGNLTLHGNAADCCYGALMAAVGGQDVDYEATS